MKHLSLFQIVFALTALLISLYNSPVHAQGVDKPKVVLLVSLDPALYPHGIAAWLHHYRSYPQKLENAFRGSFQNSDYDLEVIQDANLHDLYQVLHSANTAAVFWVSHEAPVAWNAHPGVQIDPLLVDHNRADVKAIFKDINPKIRWVSIVACDSNVVINWLKDQGEPTVQLQGFDTAIDARRGLTEAMNLSQEVLNTPAPANTPCLTQSGIPVKIVRTLSAVTASETQFFPATMIEKSGEVLGVFPEAHVEPGQLQMQEQVIYLSSADDLGLTLDSGFDPAVVPDDFNIGTFSAAANWAGASWKVFTKPDGTPFGITTQVLLYHGQTPGPLSAQTYHPYACQ